MKWLRNGKFHTKMMIFFTLICGIIITILGIRYGKLNKLVSETEKAFIDGNDIIKVRECVDELKDSFEVYISSMNQKNSRQYYEAINDLYDAQKEIKVSSKYSENTVKLKNYNNMINSYVELLESAIEHRRTNMNYKKITNNYEEADELYLYIRQYAGDIMSEQFVRDTKNYTGIRKKVNLVNEMSLVILILIIAASMVVITYFSVKITEPLEKLARKCVAITKGNYNTVIYDEDVTGEIKELYDGFNSMTKSIKAHVESISRSRLLELELAKDKINELNMKNAVKEAELSALQSQIDPHFMFNTINVGAQLAMMNEDDETVTYLENVADVFRYNLDGLDKEVTLKKEIDNSKSYLEVIKTRFGDVIDYDIDIDEDVDTRTIMMPKMSLQPLIENAYIHGVGKNEEGGTIKLEVKEENEKYYITVANHGEELSPNLINRMLWDSEDNITTQNYKGHTTRLGVSNVIKRLKSYLNRQDVIDITHKDKMNCFTLIIPKQDSKVTEVG